VAKVFIIAEAGVNHNGSLELALRLVDEAKKAGADAVKFQTFKAEHLVSARANKAEYQKKTTGSDETQLEMIRKLELSFEDHKVLVAHCKAVNIAFMSTAFDDDSLEFLKSIEMPYWKIPSGEITNMPYLRKIGALGKPILLSTGMANLGEVEAALSVLLASGVARESVTVLHCTTEYPTPLAEVNLKAMLSMGQAFGVAIGYSDHTEGISIPLAAVALGAQVIEKHFTLYKTMEGPDHKASLEPGELKAMVEGIRSIELALGNGIKQVTVSEAKNRPVARKSIIAKRAIIKGSVITTADITVKRPGTGLSPMLWDQIIGSVARHDFDSDEEIQF